MASAATVLERAWRDGESFDDLFRRCQHESKTTTKTALLDAIRLCSEPHLSSRTRSPSERFDSSRLQQMLHLTLR